MAAHPSGYTAYLSEWPSPTIAIIDPTGIEVGRTFTQTQFTSDIAVARALDNSIAFYTIEPEQSPIAENGAIWEVVFDPQNNSFSWSHVFNIGDHFPVIFYDGFSASLVTSTKDAIYSYVGLSDPDPNLDFEKIIVRWDLDLQTMSNHLAPTPSNDSNYDFSISLGDFEKRMFGMDTSAYHEDDTIYLFRIGKREVSYEGDSDCQPGDKFGYGQRVDSGTIDTANPKLFEEYRINLNSSDEEYITPSVEYGGDDVDNDWFYAFAGYDCTESAFRLRVTLGDSETYLHDSSFWHVSHVNKGAQLSMSYLWDADELQADPNYEGEGRAHIVYTGPYSEFSSPSDGLRKFGGVKEHYTLGRWTLRAASATATLMEDDGESTTSSSEAIVIPEICESDPEGCLELCTQILPDCAELIPE